MRVSILHTHSDITQTQVNTPFLGTSALNVRIYVYVVCVLNRRLEPFGLKARKIASEKEISLKAFELRCLRVVGLSVRTPSLFGR